MQTKLSVRLRQISNELTNFTQEKTIENAADHLEYSADILEMCMELPENGATTRIKTHARRLLKEMKE